MKEGLPTWKFRIGHRRDRDSDRSAGPRRIRSPRSRPRRGTQTSLVERLGSNKLAKIDRNDEKHDCTTKCGKYARVLPNCRSGRGLGVFKFEITPLTAAGERGKGSVGMAGKRARTREARGQKTHTKRASARLLSSPSVFCVAFYDAALGG